MSTFLKLLENRRTIYNLGKNVNLPEHEIIDIIQKAVELSPSSFNSQTSRVIILFNEYHQQLWDITKNELKKIVPPESFEATSGKIDSFANGFGTILFFEDTDTVKALQEQFPSYASNFPIWSEQSSGMAQLSAWTALAEKHIGASLQHYNPLIDSAVNEAYNVTQNWLLRAQMPFGSIESQAGDKSFLHHEARFKIFK